jgi:hypothetical protein
VPHGYTVVNGDGIEFGGETAELLDFLFYHLTDFMQVRVSGDKLCERIYDSYNRLADLLLFHTICAP